MIESQIFLTPAEGTRVMVPLKDPMSHGCGYVARRLVTDLTDEPFGHKILLNLTFNYSVSAEFLQNINIRGIEIPATRLSTLRRRGVRPAGFKFNLQTPNTCG